MKIDIKTFEEISIGDIFASGIEQNSPDGIYMINNQAGRLLRWVAVKTWENGWVIYVHWLNEYNMDEVRHSGDKIVFDEYIQKCVDCSKDVLKKYGK